MSLKLVTRWIAPVLDAIIRRRSAEPARRSLAALAADKPCRIW